MQDQETTKQLEGALEVTREDIARGKSYLLKARGGRTDDLPDRWLQDQSSTIPQVAAVLL